MPDPDISVAEPTVDPNVGPTDPPPTAIEQLVLDVRQIGTLHTASNVAQSELAVAQAELDMAKAAMTSAIAAAQVVIDSKAAVVLTKAAAAAVAHAAIGAQVTLVEAEAEALRE